MIITSGFNVYPREIEIVLGFHPAVQEARIVGKEDLLRGEIVKAIIVKKPGRGELTKGTAQALPDLSFLLQGPAGNRI